MTEQRPVLVAHFAWVLAVIFLMNCASQSNTVSLPMEAPPAFSDSGDVNVPDKWWTTFDDPQLNTLVDTALQSNFNLKTAWQRLRAAQAVVDRESAGLFPSLEADGQGSVTEPLGEGQGSENFQADLTSAYEIDLWGRIRSGVEAEQYRAQATLADYQTAALSLSAEIVRTWYQLAEAHNEVALLNQQIETNETVLELLENRLGMGLVQSVDILRQRQLVESTREQKYYAETNVEVLENQLAVLLGQAPQGKNNFTPKTMPELPAMPETGLSTELVQRRPDVQSAFNRLKAADRDLASAISNQYPRLTISASISTSANSAGNLFDDWVTSFAGNLLAPIFYGGELSAEVDRTEAVKQQRLYEYGQTILVAFREVENALVQEKKQIESIESIERQVELARQAYDQLRVQYLNGTSNYLDVLTALDEVQQLQRDLLTARLTLVEYRVALYRALAGSFETQREEE